MASGEVVRDESGDEVRARSAGELGEVEADEGEEAEGADAGDATRRRLVRRTGRRSIAPARLRKYGNAGNQTVVTCPSRGGRSGSSSSTVEVRGLYFLLLALGMGGDL